MTAFQPPNRFTMTPGGRSRAAATFDLEPGADGTTTIVRWEETLIPPACRTSAHGQAAAAQTGIFQADLGRLRDLVESGPRG